MRNYPAQALSLTLRGRRSGPAAGRERGSAGASPAAPHCPLPAAARTAPAAAAGDTAPAGRLRDGSGWRERSEWGQDSSEWSHRVTPAGSGRAIPEHAAEGCIQRAFEYLQ